MIMFVLEVGKVAAAPPQTKDGDDGKGKGRSNRSIDQVHEEVHVLI